jgi:hypothetical protein
VSIILFNFEGKTGTNFLFSWPTKAPKEKNRTQEELICMLTELIAIAAPLDCA